MTEVGLDVLNNMLAPPFPLLIKQASLSGSGVPFDGPLEGCSLWDSASTMSGTARSSLFDL